MVEHTHGEVWTSKAQFPPLEKEVFKQLPNHYHLAIQNCHLLPKWYLSCVLRLESSAKISRCHVRAGRIRRKSYYWLLSLSFPSQSLLNSFRIQKARGTITYTLHLHLWKGPPLGQQGQSPGWRTGEDYTRVQIRSWKGRRWGEREPVRDNSCKILLWICLQSWDLKKLYQASLFSAYPMSNLKKSVYFVRCLNMEFFLHP